MMQAIIHITYKNMERSVLSVLPDLQRGGTTLRLLVERRSRSCTTTLCPWEKEPFTAWIFDMPALCSAHNVAVGLSVLSWDSLGSDPQACVKLTAYAFSMEGRLHMWSVDTPWLRSLLESVISRVLRTESLSVGLLKRDILLTISYLTKYAISQTVPTLLYKYVERTLFALAKSWQVVTLKRMRNERLIYNYLLASSTTLACISYFSVSSLLNLRILPIVSVVC